LTFIVGRDIHRLSRLIVGLNIYLTDSEIRKALFQLRNHIIKLSVEQQTKWLLFQCGETDVSRLQCLGKDLVKIMHSFMDLVEKRGLSNHAKVKELRDQMNIMAR
jgi:hypothetical protein